VSYTGTPPSSQRFALRADHKGVTVRIKYPKPGAYMVRDTKGVQFLPNDWDNVLKQPAPIKGTKCGENRYMGVDNILEFYISPECTLRLDPVDSIHTRIRLNWTLSEFYADGGSTKFVDRLAASLGIHFSNIKVVSVFQGSVVVDF